MALGSMEEWISIDCIRQLLHGLLRDRLRLRWAERLLSVFAKGNEQSLASGCLDE